MKYAHNIYIYIYIYIYIDREREYPTELERKYENQFGRMFIDLL